MAVASMHLGVWSWSRQSPDLQTECQNGKERQFERGMVVGARRAGLSISQSAQLLVFSRTTISRVYKEWCEKGKTSSMQMLHKSGSPVGSAVVGGVRGPVWTWNARLWLKMPWGLGEGKKNPPGTTHILYK